MYYFDAHGRSRLGGRWIKAICLRARGLVARQPR
jgi:hypothetical protein